MVEIIGETYPVRRFLARIPGAIYARGVWKVPAQYERLAYSIVQNAGNEKILENMTNNLDMWRQEIKADYHQK